MGTGFVITPAILLQWYNEYNVAYFHGGLPQASLANFEVRHYGSHFGAFHHPRSNKTSWRISETDYFAMSENDRRHTLLHEMCHSWCYHAGFKHEHHGPRWRAKAAEISRLSGFDITRVHKNSQSIEVANDFKSKHQKKKDARSGCYPIFVFSSGEDFLLVKTSAKVLGQHIHLRGGKYDLCLVTRPYRMFLSNAFPELTVRRGFNWGTRFSSEQYQNVILPKLVKGKEFKEAIDLYREALKKNCR